MPPFTNDAIAQGTDEQDIIVQRTLNGLRRMRYFRRQYDPRRSYFYRQYLGQRDGRNYPDNLTPRANTFVPYARSNVETIVGRTMDAFFSIEPPFEARGRGEQDGMAAPLMQQVLLSMLHRGKWINNIELLIRNLAIYGHAGIMVDWDFDYDVVTAPEPILAMQPQIDQFTGQPILGPDSQPALMPIMNPMTGQPIILGTQITTKKVPRNRPKLTPIDVFDLLVDPDGGQLARLMEKPLAQILREAETKPDLYIPGSIEMLAKRVAEGVGPDKDPGGVLIRLAEFWDETHNTVTLITFGEDAEAVSWKDLRYSFRSANYSSYKRQVYAGTPILLRHGANPFIHKRAPILHTSYCKLTGEPFGIGAIEPISDLNEALNKFCNMITDNWNLSINRRYVYNTDADIDHNALNNFNVPGGKIGVNGNPNDNIMALPVFTPAAQEFGIMELYKQMIELSSGISDFYGKGMGSSGSNRTATGIGQVMTETNFIFKMFIRNFENDILQPMLEMCASMVQQFCSDYVEYQLTDAPPGIPKVGRIPIDAIIGNFDFDFVAANYATNKVVRQRNMMAFYQMVSATPFAQQGELLREIAKVMEIPNANRLVKSDQQVAQEQNRAMKMQQDAVLMEKILDTESKAIVAEVSKKEPNSVTAHGRAVQDVIERMLVAAGEFPDQGGLAAQEQLDKGGRPATRQQEGQIPGAGNTGASRSVAQSMGANALGLGQMGEMGGLE